MTRDVAILVFDGVEVLDFAGPFEVFGVTDKRHGNSPFRVSTVSLTPGPIHARNQLSINPTSVATLDVVPQIVVIPGGYGTYAQMTDDATLQYVRGVAKRAELVLSVCTGSLLLAKAGVLSGLGATTHRDAMGALAAIGDDYEVYPDARIVDNGNIVTSAGISAGIDMALYVVARLLGEDVAAETSRYMQYDWRFRQPDGTSIVRRAFEGDRRSVNARVR